MAHFFTVAELEAAKLWHSLTEIRRMGGVENTPRGWAATYAAAPGMWYTPVVAAWQLHRAGRINCPDPPGASPELPCAISRMPTPSCASGPPA